MICVRCAYVMQRCLLHCTSGYETTAGCVHVFDKTSWCRHMSQVCVEALGSMEVGRRGSCIPAQSEYSESMILHTSPTTMAPWCSNTDLPKSQRTWPIYIDWPLVANVPIGDRAQLFQPWGSKYPNRQALGPKSYYTYMMAVGA